jgi:uncharacterized protein
MTSDANSPRPSRRRLLHYAASGVAGGVAALGLSRLARSPIRIGAGPEVSIAIAPRPAPPLAMEEEPLPSDIHLPVTPAAIEAPTAAVRPPAMSVPSAPQASSSGGEPAWLKNARPLVQASGKPMIAIVIDDLGLDAPRTRRATALDGAVTLAFMTYASRLSEWAGAARAANHEILVHMPMQPLSAKVDPGPNALTVAMSDAEILTRVRWGLERLDGYIGVNNHMGSRFTEYSQGMAVVLDEVKARGLLFLDSRTTAHSVCASAAAGLHLPFAERNVFLDDEPTITGVSQQLETLANVARKFGAAIAIGHPHDATLDVLADWLPRAEAMGLAPVPLTSVMRRIGGNV